MVWLHRDYRAIKYLSPVIAVNRLASGLADVAAGKLFDKVALDLVDAVVRRANQELAAAT